MQPTSKREVFSELRVRLDRIIADQPERDRPLSPSWVAGTLWERLSDDERDTLRSFCPAGADPQARDYWKAWPEAEQAARTTYAHEALCRLASKQTRRVYEAHDDPRIAGS